MDKIINKKALVEIVAEKMNMTKKDAAVAVDTVFEEITNVLAEGGKADIQLEQLSSGEKQMLLILTTVFLQEEKPNILLMDEPEISLHITWQDRLVGMIRQLNPNCQLILTTHSPNIFANGWEDKIVFIEDLESR